MSALPAVLRFLFGRFGMFRAVVPFMIAYLEHGNDALQAALAEVRALLGMQPICSACKRTREGGGYWTHIESHIATHSRAEFTHDIGPECRDRLYGAFVKAGEV